MKVMRQLLLTGVMTLVAFGASAQQPISLNIGTQPMADALNQWAQQTGLQLVFPEERATAGLTAPSLTGSFTPEAALKQLLANSSLVYEFINERTVAIREKPPSSTSERADKAADYATVHLAAAPDPLQAHSKGDRQDSAASGDALDATTLEEVLVTGTHIRGARDIAAPSMNITRADIERSGVSTVEAIFETLPQNFAQINAASSYAIESGSSDTQANEHRAAGIDLRGLGPQSTLTLLNGKRRAGSGAGLVIDISAIPLSAVERVEVVTGGRSAIYGSDAVAGAVNIITRRSFRGLETDASYGWSPDGGERLQFSQIGGLDLERGGLVAAYDFRQDWALNLVDTGHVLSPDQNGGEPFRLSVSPKGTRHSAVVSGRFQLTDRTELYADGLYSLSEFKGTDRYLFMTGSPRDSTRSQRESNDQLSVTAGARIGLAGDWSLDVSGGLGDVNSELRTVQFSSFPFGDFTSTADSEDNSAIEQAAAILEGAVKQIAGITPRLAFGVEYRDEQIERIDNVSQVRSGRDRNVHSAFVELMLPLIDREAHRLELSLADRFDEYSDFGNTFNPQAGLIWQPLPSMTFRAAYSSAFRAPGLRENVPLEFGFLDLLMDPTAPGGTSPVLTRSGVRPDLGAEEADTWSTGFDFAPSFVPGMRISASYFDIGYEGRIAVPATGSEAFLALSREERFRNVIQRGATDAEIDALVALITPDLIFNSTGLAWDPATQGLLDAFPGLVVFDNRVANIAIEEVRGVDLVVSSEWKTPVGDLTAGLNTSYTLDHNVRITTTSPEVSRINEVGKPVDFRFRLNGGWRRGPLGAFIFVNYTDDYANPRSVPASRIQDWLTTDLTLQYNGSVNTERGALAGMSASLSILNVLDESPPEYLNSGFFLRYDPTNANPIGRFITLNIRKSW